MTGERRCATSAFSADQLWKPYSRANASCAADSVTRGETAPSRPAACGSPPAEQLSRLTAKLVKIRSVGKPGHDVSSAPGLAFKAR
jgi:hypothetical protein